MGTIFRSVLETIRVAVTLLSSPELFNTSHKADHETVANLILDIIIVIKIYNFANKDGCDIKLYFVNVRRRLLFKFLIHK